MELTQFCLLIEHIFIEYFGGLWGYYGEQNGFCSIDAYKAVGKIGLISVIQLPRYVIVIRTLNENCRGFRNILQENLT